MLSIRRLYAYWQIALHCRLPHSLLAAYMPLLWLAEDYTYAGKWCARRADSSQLLDAFIPDYRKGDKDLGDVMSATSAHGHKIEGQTHSSDPPSHTLALHI